MAERRLQVQPLPPLLSLLLVTLSEVRGTWGDHCSMLRVSVWCLEPPRSSHWGHGDYCSAPAASHNPPARVGVLPATTLLAVNEGLTKGLVQEQAT